MKSEYTRDIHPEFLKLFKAGGILEYFVEFVKEKGDLALCFRGNESEKGTVTIYKHNHCIWTIKIVEGIPKVYISLDHARFMENWDINVVKRLMEIGFHTANKASYSELSEAGLLATMVGSNKDGRYNYHAIELFVEIDSNKERTKNIVDKSFVLLNEIQNSFFNEKKPYNHIKKYYFDKHPEALEVDSNHNMNSRCQPCVEKHAQQDLFLNNHELKGGIFIYDTEFAQPSVSGNSVSKSNKPDMYGIRFNDEGKPETICMIEVKSTSSALKGACSIEKHKEGMEEYLTLTRLDKNKTEIPLIEDRKREACRIMNQYNDLKLYGVNEVFSEDELITLDVEIIFVLTNEISLDSSIKKDKTVKDVLCGAGYKSFDLMKCGSYPEHLEAVVKRF